MTEWFDQSEEVFSLQFVKYEMIYFQDIQVESVYKRFKAVFDDELVSTIGLPPCFG